MYYKTLQSVTNIEIQKDRGDFRLLDRLYIEALNSLRESERYTKELFSWMDITKKNENHEIKNFMIFISFLFYYI